MTIIINNKSGVPIYEQIYNQIKNQIISDAVKEDDTLPSIRSLAKDLRISVITTKRAYEELEREGYIESFMGKGCFVKAQNNDFLREESVRQTEEMLAQVCKKARLCGLSADDLKDMVDIFYSGGNDND